ncbi:hypothetical protein [Streptomyces platensis]
MRAHQSRGPLRPVVRVEPLLVPPVEPAVLEHCGPPSEVDRAYDALAAHVARHAFAVDGLLREYYLVGQHDTPDRTVADRDRLAGLPHRCREVIARAVKSTGSAS